MNTSYKMKSSFSLLREIMTFAFIFITVLLEYSTYTLQIILMYFIEKNSL